jgi:hypothetical protein
MIFNGTNGFLVWGEQTCVAMSAQIAYLWHSICLVRPPAHQTPHQRREAITRRDAGEETLMDIARSYNVSHSTISRL